MENASANVIRLRKRFRRLAVTGRLAQLREDHGLTQAEIARALGVNASSVSRWESGELRPRPARAAALLELLDGD